VTLFRVCGWDGSSIDDRDGGPLFVPRIHQGKGRHDKPNRYGAWYCSRSQVSAVAESIQRYRRQTLEDRDFARPDGRTSAIVTLALSDDAFIIDLDDPQALVARHLRPSQIATLRRDVTQQIAVSLFDEGAAGISWWSTLEATWTNVTLFHERVIRHIRMTAPPRRLSTRLAEVREAAEHLHTTLG